MNQIRPEAYKHILGRDPQVPFLLLGNHRYTKYSGGHNRIFLSEKRAHCERRNPMNVYTPYILRPDNCYHSFLSPFHPHDEAEGFHGSSSPMHWAIVSAPS